MKLVRLVFLLSLCVSISGYADDTSGKDIGAKELLQNLSNRFQSTVKDLQGSITWTQRWTNEDKIQKGTFYFKNPQMLRIDFSDPKGQVICSNGYELWVYITSLNLILHQDILEKTKEKTEEGKTVVLDNPILINPVGYDKFLRDYAVQYHETKDKTDYKDGTKVYTFKLIRWRSSQNGFNVIYLTIQENGLIRKVEGITATYRKIVLEIDDIQTNQNLSNLIFDYEPPAHANTAEDFITKQGDS